jgi:hypothetical protein
MPFFLFLEGMFNFYAVKKFEDFSFGANKCGALNDSKKGCPLLILVHCILGRFRILMSNFMHFNVSLNPHNQTTNFLFAFCLCWFSEKKIVKPTQVCALEWAGPLPQPNMATHTMC